MSFQGEPSLSFCIFEVCFGIQGFQGSEPVLEELKDNPFLQFLA